MKIKNVGSIAALALLCSVNAQAAGLYGGIGLGPTTWHTGDISGLTIDKKDTGVKVLLGSQISPNFAVEGGYVSLGKAKLSARGVTGSVEGTGLFIDLVGIAPISSEFSLLGKLGIFSGKVEAKVNAVGFSDSDSGTDVKFGFGASYALSKSVDLRGEWERYRFNLSGEKGDVDLLSIGVIYKF